MPRHRSASNFERLVGKIGQRLRLKEIELMKYLTLLFSVFSITFSVHPAAAALAPQLKGVTLDEAYQSALKKNETVLIQRARFEGTEANVSQARSAMLPDITGYATTLRQNERSAFPGKSSRAGESTTARISLVQPLFAGGRYSSAFDQTKALNEAQSYSIEAAKTSLFLDVAGSYYETLAAEADLKNLRLSVDLTQDRIKELNKRAHIGRSRAGEVLTSQAQSAVLGSTVQEAIDRVARARANFMFATGLDANSALNVPVATAESIPVPAPLKTYYAKINDRPDVKALELRTKAAEYSTDVARAGHMPTLNFVANGYWTKDVGDKDLDWDYGLGLTIPIFEGGAVQGRVRAAKSIETEAELNYRRLKRSAEADIERAHSSLSSATQQILALDNALIASEKNYRSETHDYSLGLNTNLDVLTALTTLQETRRSLDRTRFLTLLHWAELRAAIQDIPGEMR
jgi:outer membrane protein